jgi:hypothetical protein
VKEEPQVKSERATAFDERRERSRPLGRTRQL